MAETIYRNRRAVQIENDRVRATVLVEGGHIAEFLHKATGVNPLWTPPWPSIEPSTYSAAKHPDYGSGAEAKLLAGIMGHNLCLDIFGGVSAEEEAAGLTVHGEASVVPYQIEAAGARLTARAELPQARLRVERAIELDGSTMRITESVENLTATDRPVGWTQHVTLGPPFLEKGKTRFEATATRSKVFETDFTGGKGYMKTAAEFDWPRVPRNDGGSEDLRVYTAANVSGGYTTHLMDPAREDAWFTAWWPSGGVALAYIWRRADFPWLGIWEENLSRDFPPWSGRAITRGMEFGVSPMPETRRAMIERGGLVGVPGYRWIPARTRVTVNYRAVVGASAQMPSRPESIA